MEDFKKKVKEVKSQQQELKSKYKEQIEAEKKEILEIFDKKDKKNGTWFLKLYNRVLSSYSKNINYEYFERKYSCHEKDVIAKKIIQGHCNYNTAVGVVIGGGGGFFGLPGAIIATFPEIAIVSYNLLKMIYDISVIYDREIDINNPIEATRVLMLSFGIKGNEIANAALRTVIKESGKHAAKKATKRVALRALQNVATKIGVKVTQKSIKAIILRAIPVVGAIIGAAFCGALDYFATRSVSIKSIFYYRTSDVLINQIISENRNQKYYKFLFIKLNKLKNNCEELLIKCASCFENSGLIVSENKSILYELLIYNYSSKDEMNDDEKHRVKYFIENIIDDISKLKKRFILKYKFRNYVTFLVNVMLYFIIADKKTSKQDLHMINLISLKFLNKEITKQEIEKSIVKYIIL